MAILTTSRNVLRKPSWAKKNLVAQDLLAQAKESVKAGFQSNSPLISSVDGWAVKHVAPQFLDYCKGLKSPDVQAFFKAADATRSVVKVTTFTTLYYGNTSDILMIAAVLDKLSLSVDFPEMDVTIVFCPWDGAWAAEGLGGLSLPIDEIKNRFMSGNYDFKPSSWGKNVRKAIEDYAFLATESQLRLDKKGDLIASTSGGRIIFRSSKDALGFLYPEGFDPCESERISLVIDDRFRDLIAKVRECPGASSWSPL